MAARLDKEAAILIVPAPLVIAILAPAERAATDGYPFVVLPISSCPLVSKVLVEKVSAADAYIIEPFVIDVSPVPPCFAVLAPLTVLLKSTPLEN